jgi:hypothetical protein
MHFITDLLLNLGIFCSYVEKLLGNLILDLKTQKERKSLHTVLSARSTFMENNKTF